MVLNKGIVLLCNPLTVGLLLLLLAMAAGLSQRCKSRTASLMILLPFFWFWCWATPAMYRFLGYALEIPYPPQCAETLPKADAIIILGGGMGSNTNLPYAEMWSAADRVWHAARLYKAGKAPLVMPSGGGESYSSVPLLLDLGVPRRAIRIESEARNTEENALFVERELRKVLGRPKAKPGRVLVVTSAWHMRRALLHFRQTGLEAIPAATDHEATTQRQSGIRVKDLLPAYDKFYGNCVMAKEHLGYVLYRLKYAWRPQGGHDHKD